MHITLISADDEIWATGMRSISSTLCQAGHQTTMIFAGTPRVSINDSVVREITALVGDSEIIGISSMTRGASRAETLIAGLRPLGRLIVWGGMYPTLFPGNCTPHADVVCRGEGEEFMLDLAERVASRRGFVDIPNGAYLSNGRTILNSLRPPIADLDGLPLLDFAFEKEYVLRPSGKMAENSGMRTRRSVMFSGSRGCHNNCSYCSNSQLRLIYGSEVRRSHVRKMSIPRFVEVATHYRRIFPRARRFYFTDEDFFDRPVEQMRELAMTYPDQVGLPFECMASPNQITEDKVALAVKAGMSQIDVGLESGSERIRREVFNRQISDPIQMRAATAIHKHARGKVLYFLIVGNPYEGRQDLVGGVRFLQRLPPPFSVRVYNLVFIPGTRLFGRACEDGIIEGIRDSASDLDFLAGFDYGTHHWKSRNIYLDSLISLMHGESTRWRIGFVPRAMLPVLLAPGVVDFCYRHVQVGKTMCVLARLLRPTEILRIAARGVFRRLGAFRVEIGRLGLNSRSQARAP